jgi:hypothetical protein
MMKRILNVHRSSFIVSEAEESGSSSGGSLQRRLAISLPEN